MHCNEEVNDDDEDDDNDDNDDDHNDDISVRARMLVWRVSDKTWTGA